MFTEQRLFLLRTKKRQHTRCFQLSSLRYTSPSRSRRADFLVA